MTMLDQDIPASTRDHGVDVSDAPFMMPTDEAIAGRHNSPEEFQVWLDGFLADSRPATPPVPPTYPGITRTRRTPRGISAVP